MSTRKKKEAAPREDFENSVLGRLVEEHRQLSIDEQFSGDIVMLACGMKRSGKTSIVDRFIKPTKDDKDAPKPTVALDYKYARREAGEQDGRKLLAHIYDLGGDEGNENLVSVPVSPSTVGKLVVCVMVDLSEPWAALEALHKWLELLRIQVTQNLELLARESPSGAKRVAALEHARQEIFKDNPDKESVNAFPCPIVIFGTKCDVLAEVDPEKKRSLCHALRYFAHVNGASLVFSSVKEKDGMVGTRAILRKLIFGVDAKSSHVDQLDPAKPIAVLAGKDSLEAIGKPHGASAPDKAWRDIVKTYFPDTQTTQKTDTACQKVQDELQRFPESSIDGMVAQRTMELDLYRRQVERNQRLASEGVEGSNFGLAIAT